MSGGKLSNWQGDIGRQRKFLETCLRVRRTVFVVKSFMKKIPSNLKQIFSLIVFIFLFASYQFAQEKSDLKNISNEVEYYGKLDAELVPNLKDLTSTVFKPLANLSKYKFVRPLEKDAVVSVGSLYDNRTKSGEGFEILLVEPKAENPYFYADLNANGAFEENERLLLIASKDATDDFEQILKLPLKNAFYQTFPVALRYKRGFKHPNLKTGEKLVVQSYIAFAFGEVLINNKSVRVQYPFDPTEASISTTDGLFGIDVDGDRLIKYEPFSPETSYATKDEIVFRLNDQYLSTRSIDLTKNQIVMRLRPKREYLRLELEIGKEMADFSFVDFENKNRSLKEFRGKYLLIDFWGMWCVDCRRELPYQIEAYKRFGKRNFEILGLDSDEPEKLEAVKTFLAKNRITWTQARFDSIKNLIEKSYRIQEYPSAILLDPNGKVIILDQKQLTGENLLETLDKILPR